MGAICFSAKDTTRNGHIVPKGTCTIWWPLVATDILCLRHICRSAEFALPLCGPLRAAPLSLSACPSALRGLKSKRWKMLLWKDADEPPRRGGDKSPNKATKAWAKNSKTHPHENAQYCPKS